MKKEITKTGKKKKTWVEPFVKLWVDIDIDLKSNSVTECVCVCVTNGR